MRAAARLVPCAEDRGDRAVDARAEVLVVIDHHGARRRAPRLAEVRVVLAGLGKLCVQRVERRVRGAVDLGELRIGPQDALGRAWAVRIDDGVALVHALGGVGLLRRSGGRRGGVALRAALELIERGVGVGDGLAHVRRILEVGGDQKPEAVALLDAL